MKDLEHEASGNVFPGDLRERVSRQMILRELGEKGQAAISSAHFLVIGAGGLGSPAILYLAAAGAGTITVVDADTVSVSNLSRQILHTTSTVNVNKAKSAAIAVERLNPHCRIIPVPEFADAVKLKALVKNAQPASRSRGPRMMQGSPSSLRPPCAFRASSPSSILPCPNLPASSASSRRTIRATTSKPQPSASFRRSRASWGPFRPPRP